MLFLSLSLRSKDWILQTTSVSFSSLINLLSTYFCCNCIFLVILAIEVIVVTSIDSFEQRVEVVAMN